MRRQEASTVDGVTSASVLFQSFIGKEGKKKKAAQQGLQIPGLQTPFLRAPQTVLPGNFTLLYSEPYGIM